MSMGSNIRASGLLIVVTIIIVIILYERREV